ncbi:MAG: DegT/DnrJ/EryC1/StrS aminotransferase family protein [Anaerolineae bacterium]|jgi:dTDP-4-amino-4,6-dideoxygalactose transaminase|nr:DegT/DnrJ/EryC1/StrS aminotransferase family protein [Anaerolineae bacterium]
MRAAFLPYALPSIGEEEIAEVVDSLRSGWLTSGPKVRRLEGELAAYLGARHALAVSSCTAALHIALTALGIGPGDEVVVPTMTFCSTANVVVHLGARPVLVDVGPDLNVTPEAIEAALTPHTRAIVPVHYGGQPCDLEAIHALAARHGLPIVEDAAHAIGARYRDQKIGSDALAAPRSITCFSFYAIKNMTTGEGGAIATADDGLAETMRLLTLHGMSRDAWKRYTGSGSWYYEVVLPGYKDNMTDIQAALGIHQLQKLEGFIETRRRYARLYDEAFVDLPEVKVPIVRPGRCHVYHLYPILLSLERLAIERAQFIEELRARGIGTSVHFVPVHLHPFYARQFGYRPGDLPCAEALYSRLISLPLYPAMSVTDVADVIHAVGDVVRAFRL